MADGDKKFKVKEYLTTDQFKLVQDVEYHLGFKSEIYTAQLPDPNDKTKMKDTDVINVVDLDNPSEHPTRMIVNTVLRLRLMEKYPKKNYVGKNFLVIKRAKSAGGKANPFVLAELE